MWFDDSHNLDIFVGISDDCAKRLNLIAFSLFQFQQIDYESLKHEKLITANDILSTRLGKAFELFFLSPVVLNKNYVFDMKSLLPNGKKVKFDSVNARVFHQRGCEKSRKIQTDKNN